MNDRDDIGATWSEFLEVHLGAVSLVERTHWDADRRARALESLAMAPEDWRLVAIQLATWLGLEIGSSADVVFDWAERRRREALDAYSHARDEYIRAWSTDGADGAPDAKAPD